MLNTLIGYLKQSSLPYTSQPSPASNHQCLHYLGEEHSTVLQRLRFAVQQALARAGFLTTRNLAVLQATVSFLTCLRRPEDADFVWTMSAVVLRLARGFNCIVMVTSLG